MQRFSSGEAIRFGWEMVKENLKFFIGLSVAILAVFALANVIGTSLQHAGGFVIFLFQAAFFFLSTYVAIIVSRMSLNFVDNGTSSWGELFAPKVNFWTYLLASLLFNLITFAGTLLLIVPGIIWGVMFAFYNYFVIDKQDNVMDSLKASAAATKGSRWGLFLFFLTLLGINILGLLALVVGLVVTLPLSALATAHVYRQLNAAEASGTDVSAAPAVEM